jgi:hypothetical protein
MNFSCKKKLETRFFYCEERKNQKKKREIKIRKYIIFSFLSFFSLFYSPKKNASLFSHRNKKFLGIFLLFPLLKKEKKGMKKDSQTSKPDSELSGASCIQEFDESRIPHVIILIAFCYALHRYRSQDIHC